MFSTGRHFRNNVILDGGYIHNKPCVRHNESYSQLTLIIRTYCTLFQERLILYTKVKQPRDH